MILDAVVSGHDLGKGSPAFQEYIQSPRDFRGNPRSKAHAALSASLAILWARSQQWPTLEILLLAQTVAGHHSGFASLERLQDRLRPDDEGLLDEQWECLNLRALSEETGLDLSTTAGCFRDAGRWLFRRQEVEDQLAAFTVQEAIDFRIWTQFLFSILLEADKAFLALREEKLKRYLNREHANLLPGLVDQRLAELPATPLDPLRQAVRQGTAARMQDRHPCQTLTLPTGVGKTLLAATWALEQRRWLAEKEGPPPRIIVVLPFLSIIDQMEQEYRALLGVAPCSAAQSDKLMASHSISHREYELEGERLGQAYTRFFLDTWRSEVVLTTFDQLLLALFSTKTRHLMRFHRLLDALIILDEIQTLPCRLWDLVDQGLRALTREGQVRILMMSATQPALLSDAHELAGDDAEVAEIFSRFRRYRIHCRQLEDLDLQAFIEELRRRLEGWITNGQRSLITLNTRAAARAVWEALAEAGVGRISILLISADVTPRDRLSKVAVIREGRPCIVVSTQTIEAGVDIDMDIALRDFAPLDAIIQIAGRCNRNNRLGGHGGRVELLSLVSANGRRYAEMIYDQVLLNITRETLKGFDTVDEEQVLELSKRYFAGVKERMNTGANLTRAFARWESWEQDIHTLLRGEQREQVCFIAAEDDERAELEARIQGALDIEDRWERREALRRLAPDLQRRTVCLYARSDLHPEDYARPLGPYWLLCGGWYTPEAGLDLRLDEEPASCIL